MEQSIPAELRNQRGLALMKTRYAEFVGELGEQHPNMIQMRRDIETLELEFGEDEPLFATRAAHAATR